MEEGEFCKLHSEFYGEIVDQIKQIESITFTGEELKEYI